MSILFSDKPLFSGKQMIGAISLGLLIGGGIARFELKTNNIETKLDTIVALIDTNKHETNAKFIQIDQKLLAHDDSLKSIHNMLVMLRPSDVELKRYRR